MADVQILTAELDDGVLTVTGLGLTKTTTHLFVDGAELTFDISTDGSTIYADLAEAKEVWLVKGEVESEHLTPSPRVIPTLDVISPNQAATDAPAFTLSLIGTGFDGTTEVLWDGASIVPVTLVSPTELAVAIDPATATYDPGTLEADVQVANGVDQSAALTFSFTDPVVEPPLPSEGASPNTEAIPAEYHSPEPPDVYYAVANPPAEGG